MPLHAFESRTPVVADGCYIHPSAHIIGDVVIGPGTYVGPGACIRGDYGRIEVGRDVSVQDNVSIHAHPERPTVIGDHVTLGHSCVIHNCTLEERCLIGIRAVVSDGAKVGVWAVVGERAVVPNGKEVGAGVIAVGIPARAVSKVTDGYKSKMSGPRGVHGPAPKPLES